MKYAIIGAGVSGLTCAQLLKERGEDVIVFEADSRPSGMIKCDRVNGHLFHRTGGHVFNTKRQDVFDFFWKHFDKEKEFSKANRNSVVAMDGGLFVPYPIENHVYKFGDEIVQLCVNDWLAMYANKESIVPQNFEEFLIDRFGKTLYNIYFQPYNEKVWRRDLTKVPLSWLEGKLPMPTVDEMFFNNIKKVEEKKFVHSSFFYEKNNGSQFLADRLAEGIYVRYNTPIDTIEKNSKWSVNGEEFDRVIFCGNIKQLPTLIEGLIDDGDQAMINNLESHGTTSVLCEIDDNPYSWIYLPSRKHSSHRIICTGNFSPANRGHGKMSATIEFTDFISKDDILNNLEQIPLHPKYITHNYEKYTYPIQSATTRNDIKQLKVKLSYSDFYLCGRFAEWEYSNMDVCMGSAIDLIKTL